MSLISAVNLSKSFGAEDVFNDISLSVSHRARIGLVGTNGIGKTTLLRILANEDVPSTGEVFRSKNLNIGYLPQDPVYDSNLTLWEKTQEVFTPLILKRTELSRMEVQMADNGQVEDILEKYGRLQEEFELSGGYTFEVQIRQVLSGLGFEEMDYQRPLSQLSGGEKTRALLGRLLLSNCGLLLLDEPTNSLDVSAIEWLESFLKDYQGAVVCISHDRYFLDQVVTTVWEMTPIVEVYHGNYSAYLSQRAHRYEERLREYKSQQAFIEREQEYIRRNIAGQNTRQAQGRRKRLERLLEGATIMPEGEKKRLNLRLQQQQRSGDLVIKTYNLSIGYADDRQVLFRVPDLVLTRGECAALIGPNGAGKSTLLKTLLGKIEPLNGVVDLGASLKIGYFAQTHENLHTDYSLMDEIMGVAPNMQPAEIRSYLARYLFTGDDVYKAVSMLSGGERGRLALACLALSDANLLLLDEPTNHLDLPSQEVLQSVLSEFGGTILLVSHDRYLVDALATQVWEVVSHESEMNVFNGTYSEYRLFCLKEAEKQSEPEQKSSGKTGVKRTVDVEARNEKRRLARQNELEKQITQVEADLKEISRKLETPPADMSEVERLGNEYSVLQTTLDELLEEWAVLSE